MKGWQRVAAILLACMMVLGVFGSAFIMIVRADGETYSDNSVSIEVYSDYDIDNDDGEELNSFTSSDGYVTLKIRISNPSGIMINSGDEYTHNTNQIVSFSPNNNHFFFSDWKENLHIVKNSFSRNDVFVIIRNVKYNGSQPTLDFTVGYSPTRATSDVKTFSVRARVNQATSSSTSKSSDIVIEEVIVRSTGGSVKKEFNQNNTVDIEIDYTDMSITYEDFYDEISDGEYKLKSPIRLRANLTGSNFTSKEGTSAAVMNPSMSDFPDRVYQDDAMYRRFSDEVYFEIEFEKVTWDGNSSELSFRADYRIGSTEISGNGYASIWQAYRKESSGESSSSSESSEEKEPAIPTPYIIVTNYNYGGQITAGDAFTLDMSFKNTSDTVPLENIIMTITTPEAFTIASGSNTVFIDSMAGGETLERQIRLRAAGDAEPTSHAVTLDFTYEYIEEKERKNSKTTEKIAVPVVQVSRFSVDSFDFPDSIMEGDEYAVTVNYVNKGKSIVYNVSASISGNIAMPGQVQHTGNLEAGKSGSVDFYIQNVDQGPITGEIKIEYEDANMNVTTLTYPFDITVEIWDFPSYPAEPPVEPEPEPETEKLPANAMPMLIGGGGILSVLTGFFSARRQISRAKEDSE